MATEEEITLNLFVDKEKQRVVFAECDNNIVDVLFSFLTFPISTLGKVSDGDELSPSFSLPGCIRNLRQSAETMDTTHFTSDASKSMLLHPLNAAAPTLRALKVNLDDTQEHKFYVCESLGSDPLDFYGHDENFVDQFPLRRPLSHARDAVCDCEEPMTYEVCLPVYEVYHEGRGVYVATILRYVVTDDLYVSCASTYEALLQMEELGVRKENLEERKISIKRPQIRLLLHAALASETALTSMFLQCEQREIVSHIPPKLRPPNLDGSPQVNRKAEKLMISIKLLVDKASNKVLHAEAKEDFIHLLFSFLTYPIGTVVRLLGGDCNIRCLDNLYRSAHQLGNDSKDSWMDIGTEIIEPTLPPYYNTRTMKQLWDIPEKEPPSYYLCSHSDCEACGTSRLSRYRSPSFRHPPTWPMRLIDPIDGAYLKERRLFSVTDELVISPLCVQSQLSQFHSAGISSRQIEEKTIHIGTKEALALLKSCLTSRQVLSDAFLEKESKGKT